ncbi:hypothetical protein [Mesobacillus zeae]|uniref:hypothetical protein n=1 Tax=Mesobacillus zeae TaxID=1917180 RepID=UPI00115E4D8B|nr:hypothetical protein [Mesobacillus zeae]
MRYLEQKQSQLLAASLKKAIQKPSFLGLFKKTEEINLEEMSKQLDVDLKLKMDSEVQDRIKKQNMEIEKLEEEKEKLTLSIEQEKELSKTYQITKEKKPKFLELDDK